MGVRSLTRRLKQSFSYPDSGAMHSLEHHKTKSRWHYKCQNKLLTAVGYKQVLIGIYILRGLLKMTAAGLDFLYFFLPKLCAQINERSQKTARQIN